MVKGFLFICLFLFFFISFFLQSLKFVCFRPFFLFSIFGSFCILFLNIVVSFFLFLFLFFFIYFFLSLFVSFLGRAYNAQTSIDGSNINKQVMEASSSVVKWPLGGAMARRCHSQTDSETSNFKEDAQNRLLAIWEFAMCCPVWFRSRWCDWVKRAFRRGLFLLFTEAPSDHSHLHIYLVTFNRPIQYVMNIVSVILCFN